MISKLSNILFPNQIRVFKQFSESDFMGLFILRNKLVGKQNIRLNVVNIETSTVKVILVDDKNIPLYILKKVKNDYDFVNYPCSSLSEKDITHKPSSILNLF